MTSTGVLSTERVAAIAANSPLFDIDPVELYERIIAVHGTEYGSIVWKRTCQIYDENHAEEQ